MIDTPQIRYARTEDGVNIAYWTLGQGLPLVVAVAATASHLGLEWAVPSIRSFYEALARRFRVVRYSVRNCGLSDHDVADLGLDAAASDIAAVVDALAAPRVVVAANVYMAEAAIRYAVREPDRVAALVVLHPTSSHTAAAAAAGVFAMGERTWAETVATWIDPQRTDDPVAIARLVEDSIDTHDRPRFHQALSEWDIGPFLHQVRVPTLIMHWPDHRRDDANVARHWAASIPDAVLTSRAGDAAVWFDPNRTEIIDAIVRFAEDAAGVKRAAGQGAGAAATPFRTILFTDVVGSTPLLAQLKDAAMREVMRDHDAVLRVAVEAYGGRVVKTIGDAFMAEFAVPSAAVECAITMQRGIREQFADSDVPIRLRIGINAGEPIAVDDDYFGAAVVIAKRLESVAGTDEILVSEGVRQLLAGKDFVFSDRGEIALKGFEEPVRAWSVEWA